MSCIANWNVAQWLWKSKLGIITLNWRVVTISCSWGQTTRGRASAGIPWERSQMNVKCALRNLPPSPTNLFPANPLWNLKNLICQHSSIICSITVRASGRGKRPGEGRGWCGAEWGWHVAGARQLLSDGKTAQWLGPHVSWNCPGQPRNQIINSDTRHSVSWLGLAWKFLCGSISNLSLSLQSPKTSLICVYVYVKELRHSCYAVSRLLNTHSHPSIPTALFYLLDGSIS